MLPVNVAVAPVHAGGQQHLNIGHFFPKSTKNNTELKKSFSIYTTQSLLVYTDKVKVNTELSLSSAAALLWANGDHKKGT